jgi:putative transposase
VNGRKRHRLVDTQGLGVQVLVHAADMPDGTGGQGLLQALPALAQTLPRLRHLWVDSAYQGTFVEWVQQALGCSVAVLKRGRRWFWVPPGGEPPAVPRGFQVLPRRWVVERTFGWLGRWRRTSKEYEYLPATSACVVYAIMIRLRVRRLADSEA